MINLIEAGLGVAAAAGIGVAFYKHHTLSGVIASAKKEITNIETVVAKVETTAKADITAAITKLKAIF